MNERRQYLKEQIEFTANVVNHTAQAKGLLEEANCGEDVKRALRLLPQDIWKRIISEMLKFMRYDMTRKELAAVLERQIKLRKRALHRYVKLYDKEFGDDET